METGLEKLLAKLETIDKWRYQGYQQDEFGDTTRYWYNETIDVTCKADYITDMDGELYLDRVVFMNGKEMEDK